MKQKLKRSLIALLSVCMVITMMPGMAFADAETDVTTVSDETALLNAVANANGKTIRLSNNIPITDKGVLEIGSKDGSSEVSITLDLNGYTLSNINEKAQDTSDTKSWFNVIAVYKGATLTIIDSSSNGGGRIEGKNNYQAPIINFGTLTLGRTGSQSFTVERTDADNENNVAAIINKGTLTINDNVTVSKKGAAATGYDENTKVNGTAQPYRNEAVIRNGNYYSADSDNYGTYENISLTINGGTVENGVNGLDHANAISIANGAKATVESGEITGELAKTAAENDSTTSYTLSGGTYVVRNQSELSNAMRTGVPNIKLGDTINLDNEGVLEFGYTGGVEENQSTVTGTYTLDLNGKTLSNINDKAPATNNTQSWFNVIAVYKQCSLTIKDSTGGGRIEGKNNYQAPIINFGTLTLGGTGSQSFTVERTDAANENNVAAIINKGSLTINDGVTVSKTGTAATDTQNYRNEAVIRNGNYYSESSSNYGTYENISLTINGGTVKNTVTGLDNAAAISVADGTTATIKDGTITGSLSKTGTGSYSLTGGTYSVEPASGDITAGYKSEQQDNNNTYKIVADTTPTTPSNPSGGGSESSGSGNEGVDNGDNSGNESGGSGNGGSDNGDNSGSSVTGGSDNGDNTDNTGGSVTGGTDNSGDESGSSVTEGGDNTGDNTVDNTGNTGTVTTSEATVTTEEQLSAAMVAGKTKITLGADIKITSMGVLEFGYTGGVEANQSTVEGTYTLDLNGHKLSSTQTDDTQHLFNVIAVYEKCSLKIINSSETGNASIVAAGNYQTPIINFGTLTLGGTGSNEFKVERTDAANENNVAAIINKGTLTINDNVTVSKTGTAATDTATQTYRNEAVIRNSKVTGSSTNPTLTINGGTITTDVANNTAAISVADGTTVKISGGTITGTLTAPAKGDTSTYLVSGGTFSEDVTTYCVAGKKAVKQENNTYVIEAKTDSDYSESITAAVDNLEESKVEVAESVATVSDAIAENDSVAVKEIAKSVTLQTDTDSDDETVNVSVVDEKKEAQETKDVLATLVDRGIISIDKDGKITLGSSPDNNETEATVTIKRELYFDVEATSYDTTSTKNFVTLNITPKYNLKAEVATKDSTDTPETYTLGKAIESDALKEVNATPVTLSVNLNETFVGTWETNEKTKDAYILHTKSDTKKYVYKGTVTKGADDSSPVLTFTNTHGFSEFEITMDNPAVASITTGEGENAKTEYYATLQDAVDSVTTSGTVITVEKEGEYEVQLGTNDIQLKLADNLTSENVTLTVKDSNGNTLDAVTNADGSVTYKAPESKKDSSSSSGGGGSSSSSNNVSTPAKGDTKTDDQTPAPQSDTNNSSSFTDVSASQWYAEAVEFVTENNIMNGTGNGKFSPNSNLTRAMLMTMLARYDGASTDGGSTWYEKGMQWAVAKGVSDGTKPEANITREQLVTMLYRYAGEPEVSSDSLSKFSDASGISSYARNAVAWAASNGIIDGMGDGRFAPKNSATRAQVAKIFMSYANLADQSNQPAQDDQTTDQTEQTESADQSAQAEQVA